MRVVFFGTPDFAVPSLEALLDAGVEVAAVVTQPDRPRGRSHSTLLPSPVKRTALERGITVLQPERPRGTEFVAALGATRADLGVVVAYGHLLRPEVLAAVPLGMVNVHASILPRWRGAAPIHWAVLSGDRETGVSIMRVETGLDSGAVWAVARCAIGDDDTTGVLFDRLAHLGGAALVDSLAAIANGAVPVPQPSHGVTLAPKVDRAVARIDWNAGAREVSQLVRAMDPAPGAWTTHGGDELKLFGVRVASTPHHGAPAGAFDAVDDELRIAARDGWIAVREVQPAGRRRMSAGEWLRGRDRTTGVRFE